MNEYTEDQKRPWNLLGMESQVATAWLLEAELMAMFSAEEVGALSFPSSLLHQYVLANKARRPCLSSLRASFNPEWIQQVLNKSPI